MMSAVYVCVIGVFALILFRKQIVPALKRIAKKKEEKALPVVQHDREASLPRYKVLAFDTSSEHVMYMLEKNIEFRLGQLFMEAADQGNFTFDRIEYVFSGNILFIFVRFPDRKVIYTEKGGEENEH